MSGTARIDSSVSPYTVQQAQAPITDNSFDVKVEECHSSIASIQATAREIELNELAKGIAMLREHMRKNTAEIAQQLSKFKSKIDQKKAKLHEKCVEVVEAPYTKKNFEGPDNIFKINEKAIVVLQNQYEALSATLSSLNEAPVSQDAFIILIKATNSATSLFFEISTQEQTFNQYACQVEQEIDESLA